VDPYYERLYGAIRRARGLALGKDEKHIVEFVDRARLVAHAVDLRARTLYRIARAVAEYQIDMLQRGPSAARPLTQKQVAAMLGMHESTVCRATQGKLVQLPQGETVTFDHFFDAALPVRDLVGEIIGREDRRAPLKDAEIAEELARRGVCIARRTVAKYRDQLRILPCELRKERDAGETGARHRDAGAARPLLRDADGRRPV
jgi:RNA polymerase sigma-54 factor